MVPRRTPIRRIAPATLASPWRGARVDDDAFILETPVGPPAPEHASARFELAGARDRLALGPGARAGILTAGGLCPGVNDVVRGLVMTLWHGYGVRAIVGIRHGYAGLARASGPDTMELVPDTVRDAHREAGSLLGTARGQHDCADVANAVESLGLDALFCIGGDGTLRGARALDAELERRARAVAVIAIPKTIDNDIPHCSRTFGFVTAVEEAARAIAAAHAEAAAHACGVAIVQLMGRESGFIAAAASLACPDVNFCLVPEARFALRGEAGLIAAVEKRLRERAHAVVVAAEGAGAHLWEEHERTRDASGNVKLPSIGERLERELAAGLASAGLKPVIKLIDPSYMIRSCVADSDDRILCMHLAQAAAHAAMSGRSGLVVALMGDRIAHVPLEDACCGRKRLDLEGDLWQAVLASTGQPALTA